LCVRMHRCILYSLFLYVCIQVQSLLSCINVYSLLSRASVIIGLFCKRALLKRQCSAKETYEFKVYSFLSRASALLLLFCRFVACFASLSHTQALALNHSRSLCYRKTARELSVDSNAKIHEYQKRRLMICCSVLQCVAVCCSVLQ